MKTKPVKKKRKRIPTEEHYLRQTGPRTGRFERKKCES